MRVPNRQNIRLPIFASLRITTLVFPFPVIAGQKAWSSEGRRGSGTQPNARSWRVIHGSRRFGMIPNAWPGRLYISRGVNGGDRRKATPGLAVPFCSPPGHAVLRPPRSPGNLAYLRAESGIPPCPYFRGRFPALSFKDDARRPGPVRPLPLRRRSSTAIHLRSHLVSLMGALTISSQRARHRLASSLSHPAAGGWVGGGR